ncbi:hypothetical protein D3C75_979090 [compost metagenome]
MVNIDCCPISFHIKIDKIAEALELIERILDIPPLPLCIRQRNGIAKHLHGCYAISPNLKSNGSFAAACTHISNFTALICCGNLNVSSVSFLFCGGVTIKLRVPVF